MSLNLNQSDEDLRNNVNQASTNGQNNKKSVRRVFLKVCLICLIGFPLVLGYITYQLFASHTRVTKGKATAVLNKEPTEINDRTGTKYSVSYRFSDIDKDYTGSGITATKPKDKRIAVLYDPDDPTNNKPEGSEDSFDFSLKACIFALILSVIANLGVFVRWFINRGAEFSNPVPPIYTPTPLRGTPGTRRAPQPGNTKAPRVAPAANVKPNAFQIPPQSILWIEKDLLLLNREMSGEDRPRHSPIFLQNFPKVLLSKNKLTTDDIAEAATDFVRQTRLRAGKLEIPFRKPVVELTTKLPNGEAGHIEFGNYETIIRIHPGYANNASALATILCHELAHFILDQNGIKKENRAENEKLTDLFVFRCGQGLVYIQGQTTKEKLGYLSPEEMAYAHVRCSSQHGLSRPAILPASYSGENFNHVKRALEYVTLKNNSENKMAEIILCSSNHILRVATDKPSQIIRCPKCKWEKEIWLHKKDQIDDLISKGNKEYDSKNFEIALQIFRDAQKLDKRNSKPFCLACRCLRMLGKRQDAIRELQKILSLMPEDVDAQNEMRKIIFN